MTPMNDTIELKAYVPPSAPPQTVFAGWEGIYGAFSILGAYLFVRWTPAQINPFYCCLLIIGMYALAAAFIKKSGFASNKLYLYLASALALCLIINGDGQMSGFSFLAAVVFWPIFVYSSFSGISGIGDYYFSDGIKALFVMPFASFFSLFKAFKSAQRNDKKPYKAILNAVLGLALSVIPCAAIIRLLSYDSSFGRLMEGFWEGFGYGLMDRLTYILISIPCALYIFGSMISSRDGKKSEVLSREKCESFSANAKVISPLSAFFVALPILAVYLLFFFSQRNIYLSAFSGILPSGYTYAVYSREGFFELCKVSAINAGLLLILGLMTRIKSSGEKRMMKILSFSFIVATLILILTAFSKLFLYIGAYGMTLKRVYAGWFLVILTLCFLCAALKQLGGKGKLAKEVVVIFLIAFLVLSFSCPNAWIATYNAKKYLSGDISEVDVDSMYSLGYSAVRAVSLVYENEADNKVDKRLEPLREYLRHNAEILSSESNPGALSIPYLRAKAALKAAGFEIR